MPKSNEELTKSARDILSGRWQEMAVVTLVYVLVNGISSSVPKLGMAIGLVIGGPLALGYTSLILAVKRGKELKIAQLFDGFSRFVDALVAYLLMTVFVILWSLLLIVPGIIAALSYAMTYFLLADNPGLDGLGAMRKSKQLMIGHKMRLCTLGLRFIGWIALGILTFGIGFFWIIPYMAMTFAAFYEDIAGQPSSAISIAQPTDIDTP
jgi:uncharacterized membrane protein